MASLRFNSQIGWHDFWAASPMPLKCLSLTDQQQRVLGDRPDFTVGFPTMDVSKQ